MNALVPLTVAAPLLAAAVLAVFAKIIPRRVSDTITIAVSAGITFICCYLLIKTISTEIIYWYGGWYPHKGISIGICFVADAFGAGMAGLASLLVTTATVFSWRYFESVGTLYHSLMLVFLAALNGFSLTGDLFTLFVFFELMGVAAYALTAYRIEESPLEGALNFAVMNSIGGFLTLMGIGLIYGRTGALNMAQLGNAVAGLPAEGLVTISFMLIIIGLFVKAAIVPFHFWLDDAYAVAPTPVCIIFAGIMTEMGLYAIARIYWVIFSGSLGAHAPALRDILIVMGVLAAVVGGIMCLLQRHLKRLLAFTTICHSGVIMVGIAALDSKGLAGSALYIIAHGLIKASLFICTGILLHRLRSVDEFDICGKAKNFYFTAALIILGGLGLSDVPPFGTYLGKAWIDDAAARVGYYWVGPVLLVATGFTGAAVLRAAGRIFGGLSPRQEGEEALGPSEHEEHETEESRNLTPAVMIVPAALLLAIAVALPYLPGIGQEFAGAASRFVDRGAYAAKVLHGNKIAVPVSTGSMAVEAKGIGYDIASAVIAVVVALLVLFHSRLPESARKSWSSTVGYGMGIMQNLHSGHIGDYIAWLALGAAGFGIALVVAMK